MSSSSSVVSSLSSAATTTTTILSKSTIYPHQKSTLGELKLSVSDLPMLSCHYIQKGLLFTRPPIPTHPLITLLTRSLSSALTVFPVLAGRLTTRPDGSIYITCNDAGAEFIHASAASLTLPTLLLASSDVPETFKSFFALDGAICFSGHSLPLASFQLTELGDGSVFIGCAVNHAVLDGTSFWNFFNTWAELCRTGATDSAVLTTPLPDFRRNYFGNSTAIIRFPAGEGPEVTFDVAGPLRERVFHFSREALSQMKFRANSSIAAAADEILGNRKSQGKTDEVSSFQSLCALLWRSVTRARKYLKPESTTTFRMAVNCRHRVMPPVDPYYFGNAIQSIPNTATVADVAANDLSWSAKLLHASVVSYGNNKVRQGVEEWEADPKLFPLGNPDGSVLTMGSSPRFPMYEGNDFGWGLAVAVRSGRANKFDGKMSAFPGRNGKGSVELEVCLTPETMAALIADEEFMQYVTEPTVAAVADQTVDCQPEAMDPVMEHYYLDAKSLITA